MSRSSQITNKGSSCSQSNTMTSTRCTRSMWLLFGHLTKSISQPMPETGRDWMKSRNISSSTFLPFLPPATALWCKTWRNSFVPRSRFQKPDVSMGSKWQWRTSIPRLILCWLILISEIQLKRISFSMRFRIFRLSNKRQIGLSNG